VSIQRRLGPEGRFKLAMQMSETTRELMRAGLRARYPALGEAALRARLLRDCYGVDIERR
jgi:hypothetical protein